MLAPEVFSVVFFEACFSLLFIFFSPEVSPNGYFTTMKEKKLSVPSARGSERSS